MKLLFFVLENTDKLEDVLQSLNEQSITGATIFDSKGMIRYLEGKNDEGEVPLFSAVRHYLRPDRESRNVIMTALDDDKVESAVAAIESVVGDLSKKDTGVVFTVPVDFAKGLYKDGK
jgi:nitrogen regulatory protein PII